MRLPAAIDKLTFVAIYITLSGLVLWSGRSVTNYAVDMGFYRNYLMHWEASLTALRYKNAFWKPYDGQNPAAYMKSLIQVMRDNGLVPPTSNTNCCFIYHINKFGIRSCRVLLVFNKNRLMLFGLPTSTFSRLDHIIDGYTDPLQGDFTGTWSSDNLTKIGTWKI